MSLSDHSIEVRIREKLRKNDSLSINHHLRLLLFFQADWLEASVKEHVIQKVKKIQSNIGAYEKFMLDKTSIPSFTDVKLSDGLLARNRANVTKLLEEFNKLSVHQQSSPEYGFVEWVATFIFKFNFISEFSNDLYRPNFSKKLSVFQSFLSRSFYLVSKKKNMGNKYLLFHVKKIEF